MRSYCIQSAVILIAMSTQIKSCSQKAEDAAEWIPIMLILAVATFGYIKIKKLRN